MTQDILQSGTVRLVTRDGGLAGTGFVADREGSLVTCHHVAMSTGGLRAFDAAGNGWPATWLTQDDAVLKRCDIALMRVEVPRQGLPQPVPLLASRPGSSFRTRVQKKEGRTFRESVPFSGMLEDETAVRYHHGNTQYDFEGRLVRGLHILPGMSGSPVWDPRFAAVVGLLVAGPIERGDIGGFATAFEGARGSAALDELLKRNEATVPRLGATPNRVGTQAVLARATTRTLERLRDRGIVDLKKIVPREGFAEALDAYLASSAIAFPIVSATGQGKTALLATLAASPPIDRPTWLVRAADFPADEPPESALVRMVGTSEPLNQVFTWQSLAKYGEPAPLLLLDGLNELPLDMHKIADEWLPDLIGSVRRSGWRLIFTTRRELFARIEKRRIVTADLFRITGDDADGKGGDGKGWFQLGQFTPTEAEAAAKAYAIRRDIRKRIGRQPLMYRLVSGNSETLRRTDLLRSYIDELADAAMRTLRKVHSREVWDALQRIAVSAEGEPSGVLRYDHASVPDKDLVDALCAANLLERVDAGYRIIFDEVSEFLVARSFAVTPTALWETESPNILTLAIELVLASDPAAARTQMARLVARDQERDFSRGSHSFRIAAELERGPEADKIKEMVVDAAIASKHLDTQLISMTDLPSALPLSALSKVTRAGILRENGYGWREKDVYSELHRDQTEQSARMRYGIVRLIDDLLSETDLDGAGMLIDLLADNEPLSDGRNGRSNEATVASFALCMLFAHRDRVGTQRLFRDVILPERSGADALLEAFCQATPELVATELEAEGEVASPIRMRQAWTMLIRNAKEPSIIKDRASRALRALADELDERELQEVVVVGANYALFDHAVLRSYFDRIAARKGFNYLSAVAMLDAGAIDIAAALATVDPINARRPFVSAVVGIWKSPESPVELQQVVTLLVETFHPRSEPDSDSVWALENLSYKLTLRQAEATGLCAYICEIVAHGTVRTAEALVYPAFTPCEDARQTFRSWLADELAASPKAKDIAPFVLKQATGRDAPTVLHRSVSVFARLASIHDLLWLHYREIDFEHARTIFAEMLEAARERGDDEDVAILVDLLTIVEDPTLSVLERRLVLSDYVTTLWR